MSEFRLPEPELTALLAWANEAPGRCADAIELLVAEIRQLRSSPAHGVTLSQEERVALARLVIEIRDECELLADFGNRGEALAILDRLTRTTGDEA